MWAIVFATTIQTVLDFYNARLIKLNFAYSLLNDILFTYFVKVQSVVLFQLRVNAQQECEKVKSNNTFFV